MKQKTTFKERLCDSLLELLLTALFLGIGIGLILLFGNNPFDIDFETVLLIGIAVFLFTSAIIVAVIYFVKKKKGKKNEPS